MRFILTLLCAAALVGAEEEKRLPGELVKGTRVCVVRPAGFVAATRFPGFQNEASGASVMVTVVTAPSSEITKALTDANLLERGMKVRTRTVDPDGAASKGVLLHLAQSQSSIDYHKWMFVFGNARATFMVVATYSAEARDALVQSLRASVLSAWYDESAVVDREAALSFVVGASKRFPYRRVFSNAILLAPRDFTRKPLTPGEALVIVAPSLSGAISFDARRLMFGRRLNKTKDVRDLVPGDVEKLTIDDLPGLVCVARGIHTSDDKPIVVVQVMLFDDGGYYLVQGRTRAAKPEDDIAEVMRLARTFRRRKS